MHNLSTTFLLMTTNIKYSHINWMNKLHNFAAQYKIFVGLNFHEKIFKQSFHSNYQQNTARH